MVLQDGEYGGVRVARPATIGMMKTDQLPSHLEASLVRDDDYQRNGFTFGYQIKRRGGGPDPLPAGSLRWGGATGPRFFIDPENEVVAIFLVQLPSRTPLEPRDDFRRAVMEAIGKLPAR